MANDTQQISTHFPPVVAVLGHVDHGKTSLLDAIRKTSVADREHGGITQKIGASSIEILHDNTKRTITFIDTPGHEAFSKMRSRGAQAADIGILVVSAADGVKPQTKESIELLKDANIPLIVALTKVDLPTASVEKVKQEIIREGILLEGLGGDTPALEVSAKVGTNVKELLDLIILVHDVREDSTADKPDPTQPFIGIIIESKLEAKSGPKATLIVKDGTIRVRDTYYSDGQEVRIRSLVTDTGAQVSEATIGSAVEVLGFTKVPSVGSLVTEQKSEIVPVAPKETLFKELTYQLQEDEGKLALILVTDTQGSLEAIKNALPEEVQIISSKTGEVSEADILMAKSTGAIVLSFSTRIRPDIQKLAVTEKVLVRNYTIIYEMLDEIRDVLEGKRLAGIEEIYGTASVMGKFPFEKSFAMGIRVIDGRVAQRDKIRVMRGDDIIGESIVASLRVGKNPVSKVEKGHEAGIVLTSALDFQIGDVVICHG